MPLRYTIAIIAAALAVQPGAGPAAQLTGVVRVIDGDTLDIGAATVRIWGIDAPEMRQACHDSAGRRWSCGLLARDALARLIATRVVRCLPREHDLHKRVVATCSVGGEDIASWLVREGWALDYKHYSHGAFGALERSARDKRRNIWSGQITPPWAWRAGRRRVASPRPTPPPSPACVLKGNIGKTGRRIVHAPGQRDYDAVRIDQARGERWFCSLRDARAAGWRPAQR